MYVGKRNLLEAIKLLDPAKVKIDRIDLILANGGIIRAKEVMVEVSQVFAKDFGDMWIMLPDEEVIGIAVAFDGMPKGTKTLPEVLAHLKEQRKAKKVKDAA